MRELILLILTTLLLSNSCFSQTGYSLEVEYNITTGEIDIDRIEYLDNRTELTHSDMDSHPSNKSDLDRECRIVSLIIPSIFENLDSPDKDCDNFLEKLKILIAKGEFENVVDMMVKKMGSKCLPNEIILSMFQYNNAVDSYSCGSISFDDYQVNLNRAVLLFLAELDDILWNDECRQKCNN